MSGPSTPSAEQQAVKAIQKYTAETFFATPTEQDKKPTSLAGTIAAAKEKTKALGDVEADHYTRVALTDGSELTEFQDFCKVSRENIAWVININSAPSSIFEKASLVDPADENDKTRAKCHAMYKDIAKEYKTVIDANHRALRAYGREELWYVVFFVIGLLLGASLVKFLTPKPKQANRAADEDASETEEEEQE